MLKIDPQELAKDLIGAPMPYVVLVFGGLFVIASIFNNGNYIFESFITFAYGLLSSYARILGKSENQIISYKTYFCLQAILLILYLYLMLFYIGLCNANPSMLHLIQHLRR